MAVEDSLKPPSNMAARTVDRVQTIALWTLKERSWVVIVRSEYFPGVQEALDTNSKALARIESHAGAPVPGEDARYQE